MRTTFNHTKTIIVFRNVKEMKEEQEKGNRFSLFYALPEVGDAKQGWFRKFNPLIFAV